LSHKDASKYRQLAQVLAEGNIATLRFDFRGCGHSEGFLGNSTITGRWRDLQEVIAWVQNLEGFNGRLGLLGSSLGGYVALLEASRNPFVCCTVVWATPSDLEGLAERLPEVAPVPLSDEFYEDLKGAELLTRLGSVQNVLVLHGGEDHLVPPAHGAKILTALNEPKSLEIMKGADHSISQGELRERAVNLSLEWFQRYLL
jgi:alpha-beta hydrolase superfamily lysophospholipase